MIEIILHISLAIICFYAFIEDYKYRGISWPVFPVLFVLTISIAMLTGIDWNDALMNILFLVIVLIALSLYVIIRRRQFVNIFKSDFGLRDLLFLLAITPLFTSLAYQIFFVSGMIVSGCTHVFYSRKKQEITIPLAGYLAVYLNLWMTCEIFFNVQLINTLQS